MSVKHSVLQFKFENFEGLSTVRDEEVVSNRVTDCDENEWDLRLYPGGATDDDDDVESDDGMMALFLSNPETDAEKYKPMTVGYEFIVRNSAGIVHCKDAVRGEFDEVGCILGGPNFIKRSEVLDKSNNIILGGALHIDVHLQTNLDPVVKPHLSLTSLHVQNYLQLLQNESNADVSFKIGKEVITAHKLILETNAPMLFEFCQESKNDTPIHIKDATPEIFRMLLRYVYGSEIPDIEDDKVYEAAQDIIDASDRYGIVGLKLAVERALVESLLIDSDYIVELLVFAESKNCALLKEYAMSYIAARPNDILDSDTSEELKKNPEILAELIREVSKSSKSDTRFCKEEQKMTVIELRNKLEQKGLDVDGSRDMLVSRLENANKRQRTKES